LICDLIGGVNSYLITIQSLTPCPCYKFRIALQVIRVIRVICEICGLKKVVPLMANKGKRVRAIIRKA